MVDRSWQRIEELCGRVSCFWSQMSLWQSLRSPATTGPRRIDRTSKTLCKDSECTKLQLTALSRGRETGCMLSCWEEGQEEKCLQLQEHPLEMPPVFNQVQSNCFLTPPGKTVQLGTVTAPCRVFPADVILPKVC
ncbi:uncharacterized protein LOC124901872 [Homo sapiens]|uniref:uncharacterized protein LOC124901872 n=1 Tax=Homo sapiens TaxID=9606 RepID=UPI001FB09366|nr:uncharacterized protein LOC124901872 [Homo sapiens]XP_047299127.1 uncharacterized protein LOC124901872 [Homo sapiens]XP_047301198.1 uncharacterized protein LOC124901872 [Homo sapiens]